MTKEREYVVTVAQYHFRLHLVEAKSMKEARAKVERMIHNDDDSQIIESWATGEVGSERICLVKRA